MKRLKSRFIILSVLFLSVTLQGQGNKSKPFGNSWGDTSSLDLGRNNRNLSALEANIILEINKVRTNPTRYAQLYIEPKVASFSSQSTNFSEGIAVVKECIKELSSSAKLKPLQPDEGLIKLARYHTKKQGGTKKTGHTTPRGKSFNERFSYLIDKGYTVAENISYGEESAREIVLQLLIDDGVASRGHRKNIMDPVFTHIGVAFGEHRRYNAMCTIDFSGK